jgi:hypothetical protein
VNQAINLPIGVWTPRRSTDDLVQAATPLTSAASIFLATSHEVALRRRSRPAPQRNILGSDIASIVAMISPSLQQLQSIRFGERPIQPDQPSSNVGF